MPANCTLKNHPLRPYKSLTQTEALPEFHFKTVRSQSKFKPSDHINCYNLGNFQHLKQKPKIKVELPPIVYHTDKGLNPSHQIPKLSLCQVKRKQDSALIRHIETQRANYQTKKPASSMKSTTNESKNKSFSSEQFQEAKEWGNLQVHTAPEIFSENTLTLNNNKDVRLNKMRQKNIEKCLIGHSKHLPFSLEKKRVTKRLSFADKTEESRYQAPFQLNLSNIICKRESKTFLDDETENLTMLLC